MAGDRLNEYRALLNRKYIRVKYIMYNDIIYVKTTIAVIVKPNNTQHELQLVR